MFLATNSLWDYTNVVMNFLLAGKLGDTKDDEWLRFFDVVITGDLPQSMRRSGVSGSDMTSISLPATPKDLLYGAHTVCGTVCRHTVPQHPALANASQALCGQKCVPNSLSLQKASQALSLQMHRRLWQARLLQHAQASVRGSHPDRDALQYGQRLPDAPYRWHAAATDCRQVSRWQNDCRGMR